MAMVDYATAPEKLEEKYFVINTSQDYADEFDYPVISIFSARVRKLLALMVASYETGLFESSSRQMDSMDIYFGTNEKLTFTRNEIMALLEGAQELPQDELPRYKRILGKVPAVDIVDYMLDHYAYIKAHSKLPDGVFIDLRTMPMIEQLVEDN